jgi:hypothetical protein
MQDGCMRSRSLSAWIAGLLDPPSKIKAIDFTEDENSWLRATMQHFVATLNEDKRGSMGITLVHLELLDIEQPSQHRSTKPKVLRLHALPSAATHLRLP